MSYLHVNYSEPRDANNSQLTYINCASRRASTIEGMGFYLNNASDISLGDIRYIGCTHYKKDELANEVLGFSTPAAGILIKSLTIRDCTIICDGWTHETTALSMFPVYISTLTNPTPVTISNLRIYIEGTIDSGSVALSGIFLLGNLILNIDGVFYETNITGMGATNDRAIVLGYAATTARGTIRGLKYVNQGDDGTPRGIVIYGTTPLTITDQIRIEDCDFSAMGGGAEVLFVTGDENKNKVWFYGNKWIVYPAVDIALTEGASPFEYQNLHGFAERVTVIGGTVSEIAFSSDGTNYFVTGLTSGVFPVGHTEKLKVTYTVVPVMTALPVK